MARIDDLFHIHADHLIEILELRAAPIGAGNMDRLVTGFKIKAFFDPLNRHPKEEPCKKYHYDKNGHSDAAIPYRTEMAEPTPEVKAQMRRAAVTRTFLSGSLKAVRFARRSQGDPVIDDYLVKRIEQGWLGFGF